MRGYSHAIVGLATAAYLHTQVPYLPAGLWLSGPLVVGALGGLLPDLDSGESEIRQLTHTNRRAGCLGWLASWLLPRHRGWLHTFWVAAPLAALAWYSSGDVRPYLIALAVGYISHLLADAVWSSRFLVQIKLGRLKADGLLDWMVRLICLGWVAYFLFEQWSLYA